MKIRHGPLLFLRVLRSWLSRVQDQREDSVEVARPLIHGGDVAIHGEFAGAETNRGFRRSQQKTGEAGYGRRLHVRKIFATAVVKSEVKASRLGIGVNIFQQSRAYVELLRGPYRLR